MCFVGQVESPKSTIRCKVENSFGFSGGHLKYILVVGQIICVFTFELVDRRLLRYSCMAPNRTKQQDPNRVPLPGSWSISQDEEFKFVFKGEWSSVEDIDEDVIRDICQSYELYGHIKINNEFNKSYKCFYCAKFANLILIDREILSLFG